MHGLQKATEIAGALAAAHELGIIRRDLEPGTVTLTAEGARLLDARARARQSEVEAASVHPATGQARRGERAAETYASEGT